MGHRKVALVPESLVVTRPALDSEASRMSGPDRKRQAHACRGSRRAYELQRNCSVRPDTPCEKICRPTIQATLAEGQLTAPWGDRFSASSGSRRQSAPFLTATAALPSSRWSRGSVNTLEPHFCPSLNSMATTKLRTTRPTVEAGRSPRRRPV